MASLRHYPSASHFIFSSSSSSSLRKTTTLLLRLGFSKPSVCCCHSSLLFLRCLRPQRPSSFLPTAPPPYSETEGGGGQAVLSASDCAWAEWLGPQFVDQILKEGSITEPSISKVQEEYTWNMHVLVPQVSASCGVMAWLTSGQEAYASQQLRPDMVYEIGEFFELGIQLSYLLILLGLLGVGSFFVIRQVLVRRELDLSAKELQEQVRSGDASATECFELGAVMLRRKFYPAAVKYLQQAIEKWDGDDQDLAQVYNALGVSYVRDGKLEKGITQFEKAVKLQPGYVTAWNNLGDAYEKKKELAAALNAFEEVLLFDPNNRVARPRRDSLKERVKLFKGVSIKSKDR